MRCTSSLRSCRPSVYHSKMESRSVLFPTAQQVNLPAFSILSLKCWTSSKEAVNNNFKVIGLTQRGIEPQVYRSRSRRSIPLGHLIGKDTVSEEIRIVLKWAKYHICFSFLSSHLDASANFENFDWNEPDLLLSSASSTGDANSVLVCI